MGKNKESIEAVITAAENHGYSKDTAFNIVLVCCSEQMEAQGFSPKEALEKAVEVINETQNSNEALYKILKMSGYRD